MAALLVERVLLLNTLLVLLPALWLVLLPALLLRGPAGLLLPALRPAEAPLLFLLPVQNQR